MQRRVLACLEESLTISQQSCKTISTHGQAALAEHKLLTLGMVTAKQMRILRLVLLMAL